MNDAPNLDDMSKSDLQAFADTNAREADDALSTLPDVAQGTFRHKLVNYAYTKIAAMDYREAGRIDLAMQYEKICDLSYRTLPSALRW